MLLELESTLYTYLTVRMLREIIEWDADFIWHNPKSSLLEIKSVFHIRLQHINQYIVLNKSIQTCVIFTRQINQNPSATHDPTQRSFGEDSQFSVNGQFSD